MGKPVTNYGRVPGAGIHARSGGYADPSYSRGGERPTSEEMIKKAHALERKKRGQVIEKKTRAGRRVVGVIRDGKYVKSIWGIGWIL